MNQPKTGESFNELGSKKISVLILQYAIPSIMGTLVFALYSVIAQVYVAHGPGLGEHAVGAFGICLPITVLIFALSTLTGVGASSRISIFLGKGNKTIACDLVGNAVMLSVIIGLLFTFLFYFFFDPILSLIGTTKDNYPYVRDFLVFYLPCVVVTIVTSCLNNIMRASGHPKKSVSMSLLSLLLNSILVPFFVFVLKWGLQGAAIAINISSVCVFIPTLYHFIKKKSDLPLQIQSLKLNLHRTILILNIGFSPFFIQCSASIVAFIINNRLNTYGGSSAIEAYTIANTLVIVVILILSGLSQGIQPIVGYNYGAKKTDRIIEALKVTSGIGILIGIAALIIAQVFAYPLVSLFSPSRLLAIESVNCIHILSIGLPLSGFQMIISSFFQSIGSAGKAFILSITRQLIFLVPAVFVFPLFWKMKGIWYSVPFSDVLSTLLAVIVFLYQLGILKNKKRTSESCQINTKKAK
jgi:putative MATE family efflux protein